MLIISRVRLLTFLTLSIIICIRAEVFDDFFLEFIDQLVFLLDFLVEVALLLLVRSMKFIHSLGVNLNLLLQLCVFLILSFK